MKALTRLGNERPFNLIHRREPLRPLSKTLITGTAHISIYVSSNVLSICENMPLDLFKAIGLILRWGDKSNIKLKVDMSLHYQIQLRFHLWQGKEEAAVEFHLLFDDSQLLFKFMDGILDALARGVNVILS